MSAIFPVFDLEKPATNQIFRKAGGMIPGATIHARVFGPRPSQCIKVDPAAPVILVVEDILAADRTAGVRVYEGFDIREFFRALVDAAADARKPLPKALA